MSHDYFIGGFLVIGRFSISSNNVLFFLLNIFH